MMVETHGFPGVGQLEYASTLQAPEQPSPGKLLPSSQSSLSWFFLPSPQAGPEGTSVHVSGFVLAKQGLLAAPPKLMPLDMPPTAGIPPIAPVLLPEEPLPPPAPSVLSVVRPLLEPAQAGAMKAIAKGSSTPREVRKYIDRSTLPARHVVPRRMPDRSKASLPD
jgi:hypothetical protein